MHYHVLAHILALAVGCCAAAATASEAEDGYTLLVSQTRDEPLVNVDDFAAIPPAIMDRARVFIDMAIDDVAFVLRRGSQADPLLALDQPLLTACPKVVPIEPAEPAPTPSSDQTDAVEAAHAQGEPSSGVQPSAETKPPGPPPLPPTVLMMPHTVSGAPDSSSPDDAPSTPPHRTVSVVIAFVNASFALAPDTPCTLELIDALPSASSASDSTDQAVQHNASTPLDAASLHHKSKTLASISSCNAMLLNRQAPQPVGPKTYDESQQDIRKLKCPGIHVPERNACLIQWQFTLSRPTDPALSASETATDAEVESAASAAAAAASASTKSDSKVPSLPWLKAAFARVLGSTTTIQCQDHLLRFSWHTLDLVKQYTNEYNYPTEQDTCAPVRICESVSKFGNPLGQRHRNKAYDALLGSLLRKRNFRRRR